MLSDTKIVNTNYVDSSCTDTGSWGIAVAIHYQVLDAYGAAIRSVSMEPQELDPALGLLNWSDIGPSNYPGTAKFTDPNGQFWDAPLGGCSNTGPFAFKDTQYIRILYNGTAYPVRTNNWSTSSSFPGHGAVNNGTGGDVSFSR